MRFLQFFASRLLTYILVVWIGITAVFVIPRFLPSSPVESMLGRITNRSEFMAPEQIEALRSSLQEMYGLKGTLVEQYVGFLKRVLLTGDFGPSFSSFPTPVNEIVARSLPWTLGLLLTSTLISWVIGNAIGLIVGYRKNNLSSRILETVAMIIYPMPYYILALVLIILFAYIWPIFPFNFDVNINDPFSWDQVKKILYNSMLPALSIMLVGAGWWIISMKALASSTMEEDFVYFARLKGLSDAKIMVGYVARNAILPQVTMLALQLGGIFNGALIMEILFNYPGVGYLIYSSVITSDYNLMLGTISLSIVAVATTTFIVDLAYPLLDPRIRYR